MHASAVEVAIAAVQQDRASDRTIRLVPDPRRVFIQGVTHDGKAFRPSDWAERLAGTMSCFRPDGAGGAAAFIGYSPYCVPRFVGAVKGVIVSEALRDLEPMAWDFVMNFARDNELVVVDDPYANSPAAASGA